MNDFELYRSDREDGIKKGGAVNYIRNNLAQMCGYVEAGSIGLIEHLMIYMQKINLILITVYKSPASQAADLEKTLKLMNDYITRMGTPTDRKSVV